MGQRRVKLSLSLAEANALLSAIMMGDDALFADGDESIPQYQARQRAIDRFKTAYWGTREVEGWTPICAQCGVRETAGGVEHDWNKHAAYRRRHYGGADEELRD